MKKVLIALTLAVAGVASAQVTISGSIEAGFRNSVADVKSIGGIKSDRNQITFSGREDLGSGLAATFTLQNRFDISNGGTGQTNSVTSTSPETFEQSALGLSSTQFGAVRLGRFTNVLGANGARYWVQEDSGYGAQETTQYSRLSGQFQYTSPSVYGFSYTRTQADAAANKFISFVNGNGTTTTTDISAGATDLVADTITYDNGPLFVTYSVVKGFNAEASERLGGSYKIGSTGLRVAAGQFNQKDIWKTQTAHKNNYVGAEYSVGKFVTAVSYSKVDGKAAATHAGSAEKTGAKMYYSLSKRTTLELEVSKTENTTTALNGTASFVGMRHTF